MLLACESDLRGRERQPREHPALSADPTVVGAGSGAQLLGEQGAQPVDATCHVRELRHPVLAQRRLRQHTLHDRGAMIRRHRPERAGEAAEVTGGDGGALRTRAERDEHAGAFAVDAEIFGAGHRDQHLGHGARHQPHRGGVAVEVFAESEVGKIHERQQAAAGDDGGDLAPLRGVEILAGRVVTAGVQHDDGAGGLGIEVAEHAIEQHARVLRIVVGIAIDFQADCAEQGDVVGPGRVADEDGGARPCRLQQFGAEAQCAAAARGLRERQVGLATGVIAAEHEFGHQRIAAGVADRADIGLGGLLCEQFLLGGAHGAHDRGLAVLVFVDADPKVDLVR